MSDLGPIEQQPIEQRARELFERASQQVEPSTANRLRQSRREALSPSTRSRRLLPVTAAVALVAMALAWWLPRQQRAPAADVPAAVTDGALIDSDEDSEIYAWLGDAPVAPDEDQGGAL